MANYRRLVDEFWQRHFNPWGRLTRMLNISFLYLAIWYHSWIGLGLITMRTIINPFIFPKPKRKEN